MLYSVMPAREETLAQMFSCGFCEISKNNFSAEDLQTTASVADVRIGKEQIQLRASFKNKNIQPHSATVCLL